MPKYQPTQYGKNLNIQYEDWVSKHPTSVDPATGKVRDTNPGDFMMTYFPDRYPANKPGVRDNARRTFNKIVTGESTGRNLSGENYAPYKVPVYIKRDRVKPGAIKELGTTLRVTAYFYDDEDSRDAAIMGENKPAVTKSVNFHTRKKLVRDDFANIGPLLHDQMEDEVLPMWEQRYPLPPWHRFEYTPVPIIYTTHTIEIDELDLTPASVQMMNWDY